MKRKFTFLLMALLTLAGFKSWGQETITVDFESGTIPANWTLIDADGDGYNWTVTTGYSHGGSYAACSESYRGALTPDNFLVSPQLTLGTGANISFYAYSYGGYSEHIGLAVSTTGTNPSDFTVIQDWTYYNQEFKQLSVDLNAYAGQQVYLAIRHYNVSNQWKIYVDDITINLGVAGTSYNISYDNANIQHGSISGPATAYAGQTITVTATPDAGYALEHITVNSVDYLGNTFTMPEEDVTVSATFVPGLTVNDGTVVGNNNVPFNGNQAQTYPTKSEFIIPAGDLTSMQGETISSLTFYTANNTEDNDFTNGTWDVYVKEVDYTLPGGNDGYTYTAVANMTKVYSGAMSVQNHQMTIPLTTPFVYDSKNLIISFQQTAYSSTHSEVNWIGKSEGSDVRSRGGYYYGFSFTSGPSYSSTPFLPKTTFTYTSVSCPAPTGLTASNITAEGATISWTGNDAENYDIAYGVASTFDLSNDATYTLRSGLTTTSVQLTGLIAETEYKCAVKAHCSDEEESAWSAVISFLPTDKIIVDFESGIPSGWTRIDADGDGFNWDIKTDYHHSGSQALCSESYRQSLNPNNFFVSPQIALGDGANVSFYAYNYNNSYKDHIGVGISTTGNGANDFVMIWDGTPANSWSKIELDLSDYAGESVYIAFRHYDCYDKYRIYIDDIAIDPGETAEKYAITLTQPEDEAVGKISADYEQAAAGTTVTLSADFNLGYTLNYFMVDGVQIVGNTFEMPEHNVTVSVAYNTLTMYAITFDHEIDDDIISVSATYNGEPVTAAPAGTEITLSYSNLDEGYTFNYWTLNGAQLTGSTFEMPEEDAVIGVNLTERERYDVTISSDVQDYITANPSSDILDGTTVTLTISPATGYVLTELHVLDEGENEQAVTINPENSNIRTFVMPESDVTVSAVFSRVYNISIDMALVGGSISQMSAQGTLTAYPAGTQVFLFANPDEDYSFVENSFIVIRSDGEIGPTVTFSQGMYSFIMPESNVTVSATFNKTAFAVSKVITPTYSCSFSISKTAHVGIGETVTLSNFNASPGYYFDFEDVNSLVVKRNDNQETVEVNNYGNIYQFAMPTSDVTVTATFKELPRYSVFVGDVVNGTITVDEPYEDILAGAIVYFEVEPETGYTLESITVTPEEGDPFEPTQQSWYYYFTMPSSNVTISATFRELQSYTINYYVNGQLDRTMQCQETHFVNNDGPQNVAVPAGMTFEGWGVAEIDPYTTEKPAVLGNAETPTQDYNLYAVLSYTESVPATSKDGEIWVEVTSPSDLSSGDQVIFVEKINSKVLTERTGEYDGCFRSANISISNNEISSIPSNAVVFEAESTSGSWKFWFEDAFRTGLTTLTDCNGGYLVPVNMNWGGSDLWTIISNGSSVNIIGASNQPIVYKSGDFTTESSSVYKRSALFKKYNPVITTNYYMTSVLADGEVTENTTAKNIVITTGTVTVNNDIVLTMNENGLFRNKDAANFVFGYGAQLITDNAGVLATMKKHINGIEWYTISSPLAANTEFANVTNLIPGNNIAAKTYDLYRFDEKNGVWVNSRLETGANPDFTTIDKGVGYIYSNTAETTIAFAGEINVTNVECTLTNGAAHGFNLIGNPFMQNIKLTDVKSDGTAVLADGFYVLNNDETWATEPITTGTIAPLQGFLVQAKTAGTATISKPTAAPSKGERSEQNTNIEMIVSNASFKDNAYAMFGEGIGLNKVSHRNAQAPMLYVPQDGEDFAIAFMDENTTVFPLSFKAMTTGSYSISLKATDDVSTLVLVDNMTGEETNMLLEDSYTFIGSPRDNENRFTVKLKISNSQDEDEHFVYQNGSELVINGEGTLQIFDVLGRVVISEEVHGQTVNVGGLNTGAYIVRLTGESVKTQKIVVR